MKASQLSLSRLDEHSTDTKASKLLLETKTQLGFIPNIYGVMANLPGLLETYHFGYE